MIREEQCLTKNRLALAVGDRSEQVHRRVPQQALHFIQITLAPCHGAIPGCVARRVFIDGPVPAWKVWRNIVRVAAEFEDVPLTDPQVLKELPSGVRTPGELGTAKFLGPAGKN